MRVQASLPAILLSPHQLRQLGDIDRDLAGFISGEQIGSGSPSGLRLEIDIRQRLPVVVADNEARAVVIDYPGRREMTRRRHVLRGLRTNREHVT